MKNLRKMVGRIILILVFHLFYLGGYCQSNSAFEINLCDNSVADSRINGLIIISSSNDTICGCDLLIGNHIELSNQKDYSFYFVSRNRIVYSFLIKYSMQKIFIGRNTVCIDIDIPANSTNVSYSYGNGSTGISTFASKRKMSKIEISRLTMICM